MTARTPLLATFRPGLASAVVLTLVLGIGPVEKASAQGFGTIKGRLVWGGGDLPRADPKVKKGDANAKDAEVCAKDEVPNEDYVVDPSSKGVKNGFAYVVAPKGTNPEAEKALLDKTAEVVIDQKGCRFLPHAVALHKNQSLVFKSSDPVGHNIRYTAFANGGLNNMVGAQGKMTVKLNAPERNVTEVRCDIHPWMNAWFMVFDHPFFAVTDDDGSFEIKGVPAGTQRVIVRQEKTGFVTKGGNKGVEVEVKADGVTDLGDVVLTPR